MEGWAAWTALTSSECLDPSIRATYNTFEAMSLPAVSGKVSCTCECACVCFGKEEKKNSSGECLHLFRAGSELLTL